MRNTTSFEISRFLAFSLGEEEYACPLLSVKEVIAIPALTPVPQSPPHFAGIMNLRGQVISVVDLRIKFGIKPQQTEETSVIILDISGASIGVIVDSINSVIAPQENEISDPPQLGGHKNAESIIKVFRKESSLVLILDVVKTLTRDDLNIANKNFKKQAS